MSPASNKDELLVELKCHLLAPSLDAVSHKLRQLEYAEQKVQLLEERLRLERLNKYGADSEKLWNLQLELLEEEPGVSQAEAQAESEREKPLAFWLSRAARASRPAELACVSAADRTGGVDRRNIRSIRRSRIGAAREELRHLLVELDGRCGTK